MHLGSPALCTTLPPSPRHRYYTPQTSSFSICFWGSPAYSEQVPCAGSVEPFTCITSFGPHGNPFIPWRPRAVASLLRLQNGSERAQPPPVPWLWAVVGLGMAEGGGGGAEGIAPPEEAPTLP